MGFHRAAEIDRGNRRYVAAAMNAPILEREREFELARRWREHDDEDALHELVTAYARFVVRIAWGFRGYGLPVGDLMQEGNIGLMAAAARFDPARNARFSTYARWWIVAAIQDFILRHSSVVRVATTPAQRRLFFNLRRARARHASGSDAMLNHDDRERVAAALNVKTLDVERMEAHLAGPDSSLNATIGLDEAGEELQDLLADDRPLPDEVVARARDARVRSRWVHDALDTLSAREKQIIAGRFLKEERATLAEIGLELGVSKERIRQLEAKALTKLRAVLKAEIDDPADLFDA